MLELKHEASHVLQFDLGREPIPNLMKLILHKLGEVFARVEQACHMDQVARARKVELSNG